MPSASCESLFRILNSAYDRETRLRKDAVRGPVLVMWLYFAIEGILLFLAIVLGLSGFGAYGQIVLLGYYLVVLAAPLATVWLYRGPIKEAINNHSAILLWDAGITTTVDNDLLPSIMRHSLDDIELVLLEVKAAKESFGRRMSFQIGAIEKIGLFPGLLALSVSLGNLPNDDQSWIDSLAYVIAILYFFAAVAHYHVLPLDRIVKLLEFAIARKTASHSSGLPSPTAEG